MLIRWTCLFVFFVINTSFAGEIITTSDFSLIEKECHKLGKSSLVLFDVDGTLIVPNDAILNPKGKDLFKQLIARYTDRDLFRDIRMQAPHSLVDNRSIGLVQNLLEQKIPVIAFTAAPAKIRGVEQPGNWRVDELKRYGFDFSSSFPTCDYLKLPKNRNQQHFPMYKQGVLYSSFHPKGNILIAFLRRLDWKPDFVIFVDDELGHVQSVVFCLEKEGIPCLGVHYTAANEMPCELNPEQARFQVEYFVKHDVWLCDEDCTNFLLGE